MFAMNSRLSQPPPPAAANNGSGGAFYMYLGLPHGAAATAGRGTATDAYMRSKSVMGTADSRPSPSRMPQATDTYAGLQTKLPKSPMRLAPLSPEPAPAPVRAASVVDGRQSMVAGGSPTADDETNDAFAKLSKFKEMLDMGLITQQDYAANKQAVLGGMITGGSPPGAAAPSAGGLQVDLSSPPAEATADEQTPGPSPIAASPGKLPGINSHKSPKKRKSKRLGKADDIPKLRGISVERAARIIREKIEGRLEGGPAGLRRAFQYFDTDGSGSIDREEMVAAMRVKLQLVFDDELMDKLMDRFDKQGTGNITYQSFCEMVMGSTSDDSTSFSTGAEWVQPEVLLRMIRESAKDLRISFTHKDPRKTGKITVNALRGVMSRFNIYLTDLQFNELMQEVGLESNGDVDFMGFLKHFRVQEIRNVEKSCVGVLTGLNKRKAIQLIRDTIERRLEGGPAGLRRAFQFFDEDGGGTISHDEFKKALRMKTMLIFEDSVIDEVMQEYDPQGTGEITYNQFCEMVMGSKATDGTSFSGGDSKAENFEQMMMRKVRECAKSLKTYCQHCDAMETGTVTEDELLLALQRHDIVMNDKQFSDMLRWTSATDPGGNVRYLDWLDYFRKQEIKKTNSTMLAKISGITHEKAMELVRDKIGRRMKGGPAGLRRAYQEFCDDGSGVITPDMFRRVLAHKLMIDFDDKIWGDMLLVVDPNNSGSISYGQFCLVVMGSSNDDNTSFGASPTRRMDQPEVKSDDARSFAVTVRRRVLQNWKDLKNLFIHVENQPGREGGLSYVEVRKALERVNIDCSDSQFETLMAQIDTDGDMCISHNEFLAFMKESEKRAFEEEAVGQIAPKNVDECIKLIQNKIQERLEGGPAELRRAFQYFDTDGSGDIDMDELKIALKMRTMLIFDDNVLQQIFDRFTNSSGQGIKYKEFCQFIMGSAKGDATSMTDSKVGNFTGQSGSRLMQAVQRLVREQWKVIWTSLQHEDPAGEGMIGRDELRNLLKRYDMVFTDMQWNYIVEQCADEEDEWVDYNEFMALFPPYY